MVKKERKTKAVKKKVGGSKPGPTKYTVAFITSELTAMTEELLADKDLIYLGQLFLERDYSMQRFSEWTDKYEDNRTISEAIKRIKDILLTRLNTGALQGKLNPAMTIFNLKNNYGWKDKTEQTVTGEVTIRDLPSAIAAMIDE